MSIASLIAAGMSLFSGVKEIYQNKQELKKMDLQAEIEIKKAQNTAKIDLAKKQHTNNTEIDKISVNKKGPMDDFIGIIAFTPLFLLLVFNPLANLAHMWYTTPPEATWYYQEYIPNAINAAFTQLKNAPNEYWYFVAGAYIHFLGMRGFATQMLDRVSGLNPLKGLGKKGK